MDDGKSPNTEIRNGDHYSQRQYNDPVLNGLVFVLCASITVDCSFDIGVAHHA